MDYKNVLTALDDLHSRFEQIPMGNSDFQEENFVIADALTPTRAYRQICLQLQANLNALREAHYEQRRIEIKLDQLMDSESKDVYSDALRDIDIEEMEWKLRDYGLRISNYTHSVKLLSGHLEKFPRFTREQFEAGERGYFERHLSNQINGIAGARKELMNIQIGMSQVLPELAAAKEKLQIEE